MKYIPAFLIIFITTHISSAQLWSGAEGDPTGWKSVEWFGNFWSPNEDEGWLYHEDLGWLYAQGQTQASISFYNDKLDWFFSGDMDFPNIYVNGLERWFYYSNNNGLTSYPLQYWDYTHSLAVSANSISFEMSDSPLGSDYTLKQSFVVIRHGQRFPEDNLVNGKQYALENLGVLTDVGKMEERNLGRIFQAKMAALNLTKDNVFLTADGAGSSTVSRTVESAKYFTVGLGLYSEAVDVPLLALSSDIFEGSSDTCTEIIENDVRVSDAMKALDQSFRTNYQQSWQDSAGMSFSLDDCYDLADYLQFNAITGESLPGNFSNEDINEIWRFNNELSSLEYANNYYGWKSIDGLFVSFANGISGDHIGGQATTDKVFFLFGGHDGNLVPLMSGLKNPIDANPIFASFLMISVYTNSNDNMDYVHAIYNGQSLDLSQIPNGANPCPVHAFVEYVGDGPETPDECPSDQ